jgi:hypothetical protein
VYPKAQRGPHPSHVGLHAERDIHALDARCQCRPRLRVVAESIEPICRYRRRNNGSSSAIKRPRAYSSRRSSVTSRRSRWLTHPVRASPASLGQKSEKPASAQLADPSASGSSAAAKSRDQEDSLHPTAVSSDKPPYPHLPNQFHPVGRPAVAGRSDPEEFLRHGQLYTRE